MDNPNDWIKIIERRANAATPGPWISHVEGRDFTSGSSFIQTASDGIEMAGATPADQDFIAHARQDVLLLIKEIRRLCILAKLPSP